MSGAASGSEGPWIAFIVLFGGLAFAILLIAAFGGGVGPRPVIGTPAPDTEEEHPSEEHGHAGAEDETDPDEAPEDPPDEG